jgi:dolichol-phosphate mannosyltransferase
MVFTSYIQHSTFDILPMRATVVVPTYNEAGNLPELTRRIRTALPDADILVVDDASPDGTAAAARDLGVRVIERRDERGLSSAVVRGFAEAQADVLVVMDADLSHPPEAIPQLVAAVEGGADMSVGSRYVPGGEIDNWPLLRRMTSRAGTLLARPLTSVRDPLAGFFCLRRSLLDGVTLKPRGFKILLEILARARPRRVVEIPIRFQDRGEGQSKFGPRERKDYLRQLRELYVDLNAWPLRLAKFLTTGATGLIIHLGILAALIRRSWSPTTAACVAFTVAMTWNYGLNRVWSFRAKRSPLLLSYLLYAVGTLGGLGVQLGAMHVLSRMPVLAAAAIGIVAGTAFNYAVAELLAFRHR